MVSDACGRSDRLGPSDKTSPCEERLELTRSIGRTGEVREVLDLLASSRLVTLTGSGGCGKTRLALEVARRLREQGETVVWTELASLDDPALLLPGVLNAFGVRSIQPMPDPASAAPFPGMDPLVLVLDNCEHMVEACAGLVEGLLRTHPLVRVLTTSREVLGVRGERAWLVPPLSLPGTDRSLEDVAGAEAVALFLERARDVRADFRLTSANAPAVAEICTRLDGIPLAIELAAARVRVLTPEQIRDRLDDALRLLSDGPRMAVPRHRTMESAVRWSYDRLSPESRVLLERLSVFRGSFDLDQAEAVVGSDDILDGIALLVARSLVQVREEDGVARYVLLETIRQFAAAERQSPVDPASEAPPSPLPERHRGVGLQVRALGPLEVELDGQPLDPEGWSYSRPREALVYLLLRPRGGTRDEIGQALWPDSAPAQTRNSFHVTLHHLRKALGHPDRVVLDGDRYRLSPELCISWDGGDFEEGLRKAFDADRRGEYDKDRLSRLLGLYRGELLEEHAGTRWLEEARDRFRRLKVDGHMLLARILMDEGDPDRAVPEYEAVIAQEELNEEAHRGLMTAWARAGHRDRALRHYQRLVVILAQILQTEPEEETRDLNRRIQAGEIRVWTRQGQLEAVETLEVC